MAYAIKNNELLTRLNVGGREVEKVYQGERKVWQWLPNGYTELEYLENDGLAYIKTEFCPTANTVLSIVFEMREGGRDGQWKTLVGVRVFSERTKSFALWYNTPDGKLAYNWGADDVGMGLSTLNEKHRAKIYQEDSTLKTYVDGNLRTSRKPQWNDCPYPVYLFALNAVEKQDIRSMKARIYHLSMEEDGALKLNMIPCINPQGEYGMYDTIGRKFYGNANSQGTFTGEPLEGGGVTP